MFKTIKNRKFYPDDFDTLNKDVLNEEINKLLKSEFNSFEEYQDWVYKTDEFMSIFQESYARCHAESTCDTENKEVQERMQFLNNEIFPMLAPLGNQIDMKFLDSPYLNQLDKKDFEIKNRNNKNAIELFKEENI